MTSTPPPIPFVPPPGAHTPVPVGQPPFATPHGPGLSPEQFRQIAAARQRGAKIRRGVAVALFDGWTIAVFAGLTLIGGLFHWVGLLLGTGMAAVAYVELKSVKRLRQLDPRAASALAWNQVFLGSILLAYALYSLWKIFSGRSELSTRLAAYPELASLAIDVDGLTRAIGLLVYGTLIAVAVFGQGGTALFYLSRRKHIESYLRETPQWILDAQRAGMPM